MKSSRPATFTMKSKIETTATAPAVKTRKVTRYFIRTKGMGGEFCADGFSKYYQRLTAKHGGKLRGSVYGPKQALEHINELRQSVYEGKKHFLHATFEIVRETATETIIGTEVG